MNYETEFCNDDFLIEDLFDEYEDEPVSELTQESFLEMLNSNSFFNSSKKSSSYLRSQQKGVWISHYDKQLYSENLRLIIKKEDYFVKSTRKALGADALFTCREYSEALSNESIEEIINNPNKYSYLEFSHFRCKKLSIEHSLLLRGIQFTKNSLIEKLNIDKSYLQGLKVSDSPFPYENNSVSISNSNFEDSIIVFLVARTLRLENVTGSKLIIVIGNSGVGLENKVYFRGKIEFSDGIEVITLKQALEKEIISEDELHEDLHNSIFEGFKVGRISFDGCLLRSSMIIENISVKTLEVETSDFEGQFKLLRTNIETYKVNNSSYDTDQPLELRDVNINEKLELSSSRFYSAKFINCSLDKVTNFSIENCDLSEILSLNTQWKLLGLDYCSMHSNYFKFVHSQYKSEGNIEKQLQSQVAILENARHTTLSLFDKALLTLGYKASKHGTCLKTAILSFFFINILSFFFANLIILCIGISSQDIALNTLNRTPFLDFKDAVTMLNPTHRIETISYQGGVWFYLYSWLTRIFNGYLIFQIIKSSRKYLTAI